MEQSEALAHLQMCLEMTNRLYKVGRAGLADVVAVEKEIERVKGLKAPAPAIKIVPALSPQAKERNFQPVVVESVEFTSSFTKTLEELTLEKDHCHKQMCLLSNLLYDIPADQNAIEQVTEIRGWKVKRQAVAKKIAYFMANKKLPEEVLDSAHAPDVPLPDDLYLLEKEKQSLREKITKAGKALTKAKTEKRQFELQSKIAISTATLAEVVTQIKIRR
jgi:hypothetical protein